MTVRNRNRVPLKQWRKWTDKGRETFNGTYGLMMADQKLFLHPKQDKLKPFHWKTTAWNAAWIAADCASGTLGAE